MICNDSSGGSGRAGGPTARGESSRMGSGCPFAEARPAEGSLRDACARRDLVFLAASADDRGAERCVARAKAPRGPG